MGIQKVCFFDQVKAVVKRKEVGYRDEDAREWCLKFCKRKIERLKGAFINVRRRFKNNLKGK